MDEKVESSQKNKNLNHENVVMKDQIQKNWYIYRFKLLLSYRLKMFKSKKNNGNNICLAFEHFQNPNPSFLNPKPIMEAGKEEIADVFKERWWQKRRWWKNKNPKRPYIKWRLYKMDPRRQSEEWIIRNVNLRKSFSRALMEIMKVWPINEEEFTRMNNYRSFPQAEEGNGRH